MADDDTDPRGSLVRQEPTDATGLAEFVEELRAGIESHPEVWENVTLDRFLEAFSAVLIDHQPFLLKGHCEGAIPYSVLAHLLYTAGIYE